VRRGHVIVLIAVTSGLLSVLLAVAVNVATGGVLPGPLAAVSWLAWPAVGVLGAVGVWLTVWQQRLGDDDAPAGRDVPARPAELPAQSTGFAGRGEDLATVGRILAGGCRVLVLVGPPGVGKSTLALHVAYQQRAAFGDGQLFAALRGAADPVPPQNVLNRFLGALGVPEDERRGGADDLAARFRSTVADRKLLLLLDDARDAEQVRPLLPAGAGCLVLVTSRRLITELTGAVIHRLGGLDEADGRALLASVAGAQRVDAEPDAADRIVRLCGGLPLAVRIAGSRLRARPTWTVADLARRLDDDHRRLDELRVGDVAVRSTFATSYRELSTVDWQVFRRAGWHPGRVFGTGAAAALAGLPEPAAAAALERLVDAHLVETSAPERYWLHDLLRLFAVERLTADEPPEDRDACRTRLLRWYTTHAERGDWLARERDNVVAAVRHAVQERAFEPAWALVSAVDGLLEPGDHPERVALWRDAVAAAEGLGDDGRRVTALRALSVAYRLAGDVTRGPQPAREAVAVARRTGDRRAQAEALFWYGQALRDLYRYAEAEAALQQALELYAGLGDAEREVDAATELGTLYNTFWQPERALAVLQRAVAALTGEETHRHAWVFNNLSIAYKFTDRHDEAKALNARAVRLFQRLGDDFALGYALQERGWLAGDERRYDDAVADMRRSLELFERIRHGSGVGQAHESTGHLLAEAGRPAEALAELDAAVAQFERLRDTTRRGKARLHRAGVLADLDRPAEARAEWAAAERLLGEVALPEVARARQRLAERLDGPARNRPDGS
jgi:tetratricopeptide (TPR) repeat protein/RecA/RadA recombinase